MNRDWTPFLISNPRICGGQLCAKGTRIPVTVILDALAEGLTVGEIQRHYPTLKPAHVKAAMVYAADLAREEEITPLTRRADKTRREPVRRAR